MHCARDSLHSCWPGGVWAVRRWGDKGPAAACPSLRLSLGPPSERASLPSRALLGDGSGQRTLTPGSGSRAAAVGRPGLLLPSGAITEGSMRPLLGPAYIRDSEDAPRSHQLPGGKLRRETQPCPAPPSWELRSSWMGDWLESPQASTASQDTPNNPFLPPPILPGSLRASSCSLILF